MKIKKYSILLCLCISMFILLIGCGSQSGTTTETEDTETTTEEATTEEVTEFKEDQETLSFSDIENGINFKASGTSVTLQFEDMSDLDNSLEMEFSLTDAAYEKDPVVMSVSEDQSEYLFDDLEAGTEYYLEVYPTKSADSDEEYEEIQEKNSDCQLQLIQSETGEE